MKIGLIIIGFLLSLCSCSAPPPRPESIVGDQYEHLRSDISWRIKQSMEKDAIPGLSIALVDDNSVIWAQGFGLADRENRIPATAETVYRVGSITKLFTASAVMQLQEKGIIDIDQPLNHYLPDFSIINRFGATDPVTVRNILSHHSGLPSDQINGTWSNNPDSLAGLSKSLQGQYLAFRPNSKFLYSNLAYSVLGQMLTKVSGMPYERYVEKKGSIRISQRTLRT